MAQDYVVRSDRAQVVTGLGVFEEGEEKYISAEEEAAFTRITGLPLAKGNVPEGVTVQTKRSGSGEGKDA